MIAFRLTAWILADRRRRGLACLAGLAMFLTYLWITAFGL